MITFSKFVAINHQFPSNPSLCFAAKMFSITVSHKVRTIAFRFKMLVISIVKRFLTPDKSKSMECKLYLPSPARHPSIFIKKESDQSKTNKETTKEEKQYVQETVYNSS